MPTFPTLTSCNPSVKSWEEGVAYDPTIRSPSEAGYVQTRARFTRISQRWHVVYPALSSVDKGTLKTFETVTVLVGALAFDWTSPSDSTLYSVRFKGPISYRPSTGTDWLIEFDLEGV